MKKKILSLALALALAMTLTACGGSSDTPSGGGNTPGGSGNNTPSSNDPSSKPADTNKGDNAPPSDLEETPADQFEYNYKDGMGLRIVRYLGDSERVRIPKEIDGEPVVVIGYYADVYPFAESGVVEVYIPDSVKYIGSNAFKDCYDLKKVNIPDSVLEICDSAFQNCTSLTSIAIPSSVTLIRKAAFEYCTGLTEISLPEGLEEIGFGAFFGCTGLTKVKIPDSVKEMSANWGGASFDGIPGLTVIHKGITYYSTGEGDDATMTREFYQIVEGW